MFLRSDDFDDHGPIPETLAFCKRDPEAHAVFSANQSPHLEWGDLPEGTLSLVLTCVDGDVPTKADDVNQEGRSVPLDLERTEFVHWLLIDVPSSCAGLARGECSDGVVPGGKSDPPGPAGSRQGANDYGNWFAGDAEMGGTYLGYDGPAPPWNDLRLHHYRFQLFALDVAALELPDAFTLPALRASLEGHVQAEASWTGTFTLNPDLD